MEEDDLSFDISVSLPLKKLKLIAKKKGQAGCLKRKRGEPLETSVKGKKRDRSTDAVDIIVLKDYDSTDAKSPIVTGEYKRTKHDGARYDVDKLNLKDQEIVCIELPINTGESRHAKHDRAKDAVDKLVLEGHEVANIESTENTEESKVRKDVGAGSFVDEIAFKDHAIDAESAKSTVDSEGTKNDGDGGYVDNMVLQCPAILHTESPTNTAEPEGKKTQVNGKKLDESGGPVDKNVLKDNYMADPESPINTGESNLTKHVIAEVVLPKNIEDFEGTNHGGAGAAIDKMALNVIINDELPKNTAESKGSEDASAEKAANHSDTGYSTREGFLCGRTVNQNQWNKGRGRLIERVKEYGANNSVSDRMQDGNQGLPCMETSSMWKIFIQSLEVLETVPQKPHFHPLKQCKEMYRNGLAFGYMITFAEVVKKTSDLRVKDPQRVFDSISESLQDLELHGFDVQPIQNRLAKLQLMNDRQEQLQEALKEFENQILECTSEQTKINAEFAEVVEKMKLLEKKKRRIMLHTQENDLKITELKSNFDVCNQDIVNSQLDFESLAAAPW